MTAKSGLYETEVKLVINDEEKKRLLDGADFVSEKKIEDAYYDDENYSLTTKDTWLRKRNGSFEIKVAQSDNLNLSERKIDRYKELTSEDDIREFLKISKQNSLEEDILSGGYKSFSTYVTQRRKYKLGDFTIDVDSVDFGFELSEVEMLSKSREEQEQAEKKILAFLKEKDITPFSGGGKLIQYIKRFKPEHHQALVDAGIIEN